MLPETTVVVAEFAMSGATPLPSKTSCDGPEAVVTVAAARNGLPWGCPPLLVRMMSVIRAVGKRGGQDERLHVEANLAVAERRRGSAGGDRVVVAAVVVVADVRAFDEIEDGIRPARPLDLDGPHRVARDSVAGIDQRVEHGRRRRCSPGCRTMCRWQSSAGCPGWRTLIHPGNQREVDAADGERCRRDRDNRRRSRRSGGSHWSGWSPIQKRNG